MRFSLGGISNSVGKLNAVFACLFRSKMGCGQGRTNSGGRFLEGRGCKEEVWGSHGQGREALQVSRKEALCSVLQKQGTNPLEGS